LAKHNLKDYDKSLKIKLEPNRIKFQHKRTN